MPRPNKVKYIVIHCTASWGTVDSVKRYWRNVLGWRNPGYHRFIDEDGTVHKLANYNAVTNGVRGYNNECIHISYKGGVDRNNVRIAKDTRTASQKEAIIDCIEDALKWLKTNGQNPDEVIIQGHRDFPNVAKDCPSFDAKKEYNESR
jgi:N-acetylmuramoyl-L-alanine amidase